MVGALYRTIIRTSPPPIQLGVHPPPIPSQNAILENPYSGGRPVLILILSAMRNANSNA